MDLSKLSESQLEIAKKVAAEAQKQGINPSFVLPMVMAESGFDPKARSPKDAFGVMQLTKDTAETLGVDRDDLDQNIAGGVKLLKQLVSNRNIGNDPNKVLMGYNAGPGTKFFRTGDIKDLPDETLNHIVKVSNFYGAELPQVSVGEQRQEAAAERPAEQPETPAEQPSDEGDRLQPSRTQDIPGASEAIKPFIGITGGGTGLATAASLETTKKVAPLLPNILNTVAGREVSPNQPVSRMSLQRYLNSQIAPNLRLPLSELERVAGGTKIRTMSEVQNALRAIQTVEEQRAAKPMVRMVPGRPGVFEETGRFTTSVTPGRPGVDLTRYEVPPRGPLASAVGRELQTAGEVGRAVAPSLGRVAMGGLGGAGAAMSGYDAYELAQKIKKMRAEGKEPSTADLIRLATKTAATAGGALSMLPFGVTQVGGLALSAPELAISGYEALRDFSRRAAQEERPTGNPMGDTLGGLP